MDYDDFYADVYFEDDEYIPQYMGCLPILFTVITTALVLIFALSKIEIVVPASTEKAENSPTSTGLGGGSIAPLFTPEVQYWSEKIAEWSQKTGIDPNLIATVMQIESCGDPSAKSSAGAMGLFQVMPYHFDGDENPYKPNVNARRGLNYLQQALDARDGIMRFGFAGYNGGITGAKRPESQWANETQRYVYWGTGILKDAQNGNISSDRLDEWLGHGGSSLCNQAAQRLGINK
jgi:hypothetical protein